MFERFTDRARRVVVLTQEEALRLNHNYIGTEHILLGLIREGEGRAAIALESLGTSLVEVRAQVEEIIGRGGHAPSSPTPFTPRAKRVLERALDDALQLGDNYVETGHILLGLIHEPPGVAVQILRRLEIGLDEIRDMLTELVSDDALTVECERCGEQYIARTVLCPECMSTDLRPIRRV